MNPILRVWGLTAAVLSLLLLFRGAFAAALVLFVLSPAPVLLFAQRHTDQAHLSRSWLRSLAAAAVAVCLLLVLVIYLGGIPQVHEWPAALRGGAR